MTGTASLKKGCLSWVLRDRETLSWQRNWGWSSKAREHHERGLQEGKEVGCRRNGLDARADEEGGEKEGGGDAGRRDTGRKRDREEDRAGSGRPVGLYLRRTRLKPRVARGPWSRGTLCWERSRELWGLECPQGRDRPCKSHTNPKSHERVNEAPTVPN